MGLMFFILGGGVAIYYGTFVWAIWARIKAVACLCRLDLLGASCWFSAGSIILVWWGGGSFAETYPFYLLIIGIAFAIEAWRAYRKERANSQIPPIPPIPQIPFPQITFDVKTEEAGKNRSNVISYADWERIKNGR